MARQNTLNQAATVLYRKGLDEGRRLQQAGRLRQALAIYHTLIREYPKEPSALIAAAVCERSIGNFSDAVKHFVAATNLGESGARLYNDLAGCYAMLARFDDAQRALDKAIKAAPGEVSLVATKAEFYTWAGEHENAQEVLKGIIDAGNQDHPTVAQALAPEAVAMGQEKLACELLEKYAAEERIPAPDRSNLLFRLVKLQQKQGDHDAAWASAVRANELRGAQFDPERHTQAIDQIIESWPADRTRILPKAASGDKPGGSLPVFILGMPRSGTSLLEQMLDCSDQVHAGGELQVVPHALAELTQQPAGSNENVGQVTLDQKRVDRVGAKLIEHYRRLIPSSKRGAAHVTDKLPWNFSQLGMISRFLPGAKIIHCTRNPMDTCISCYMQGFFGHLNFAYDLSHLGYYYAAYKRLMDHWKASLEIEILDVPYEEVVGDTEAQLRRVCEFLDIGFDEAMLSPHESGRVVMTASQHQVREPINDSSIGRWKRHEEHLGPLKEALGDLAQV